MFSCWFKRLSPAIKPPPPQQNIKLIISQFPPCLLFALPFPSAKAGAARCAAQPKVPNSATLSEQKHEGFKDSVFKNIYLYLQPCTDSLSFLPGEHLLGLGWSSARHPPGMHLPPPQQDKPLLLSSVPSPSLSTCLSFFLTQTSLFLKSILRHLCQRLIPFAALLPTLLSRL